MKTTKRFVTAILMLMLVLALAVPTFAKSKAKKPKLSQKKVTLETGGKVTLTLKNAKASKVKWSSTNKKVATVKKGKVTAKWKNTKKSKTCYIKAKYKGKTYKCKVTVKKVQKAKIPASSPNYISRELQTYVDNSGNFKPGVVTTMPITQTSLSDGKTRKTYPSERNPQYILWKGRITKDIMGYIYTFVPLVNVNGSWYVRASNSTSYGTFIGVMMVDDEGPCSHTGVLEFVGSNPPVEADRGPSVVAVKTTLAIYNIGRYTGKYLVEPGNTFTVTVRWRGININIPFYVPVE